MAHKFASAFAIQSIFISTIVLINEVSDVTGHRTSSHFHQEIKGVTINTPYFSCTTADFEIQYFIKNDTVGVLVNTELIFYDWQQSWLSQLKTNVNECNAMAG